MNPRNLLHQLGALFTAASAVLKKPPAEQGSQAGATLQSCIALAMEAAEREYQRPVMEPPGEGWWEIDKYIRHGLGWNRKPYTATDSSPGAARSLHGCSAQPVCVRTSDAKQWRALIACGATGEKPIASCPRRTCARVISW